MGGKVDFASVRELLGDAATPNGKYGLTWHGKRRARKLKRTRTQSVMECAK